MLPSWVFKKNKIIQGRLHVKVMYKSDCHYYTE